MHQCVLLSRMLWAGSLVVLRRKKYMFVGLHMAVIKAAIPYSPSITCETIFGEVEES